MGIQPCQSCELSLPTGAVAVSDLWQGPALLPNLGLVLQLLLCLPLLWEDRTGQENGDSAGLPLPVAIPWKPQALEGLVVTSGRWDVPPVTIAPLGCRFSELLPTAIPNKT